MDLATPDIRPDERSWTVAIYVKGRDKPAGSGVLIDRRRVLTCRHVVADHDAAELSVVFAAATEDPFRDPHRVAGVQAAGHPRADVAVLTLEQEAPGDVLAAPLKRPRSADLIGSSWWAYGFSDDVGNSSHGKVGEDLAFGWVRLDSESRYHVLRGFSGAGLWSRDYDAVVGVVGQAHETGDGRAVTVATAAGVLPDQDLGSLTDAFRLADAGADAAAEWGWRLASDEEGRRHWWPRARGVTHEAEAGWRFRGRRRALAEIVDWLTADHVPWTPLVVTGSPGVGKSAVLARVVTTADEQVARELPDDDAALRAPLGSISCAVHAKGKSALDVAREVARAASAEIPDSVEDMAIAIREALAEGAPRRFTVVVDALDEATTPTQARAIVHDVLRPLAENCADVGARALVGTRRHDDGGDLLVTFGTARQEIDLDHSDYFDRDDLAAYALATLQLTGNPRPDSPYLDPRAASQLAERIAETSVPNFLVAGLLARQHGLHDDTPIDPASITLPGGQDPVHVALGRYLARMAGVGDLSPAQLLLPLAYAETPGLDASLWATGVTALSGVIVEEVELREWAAGSAANFLIQTSQVAASFRLFHQALNDTLVADRPVVADQQALTRAFARYGSELGWAEASPYLWRSLPHHARAGHDIDTVLADLEYVLYADLARLIPAGTAAQSTQAQAVATLIRRTPQAIDQNASTRLALFMVVDALDRVGSGIRALPLAAPYRPVWAQGQPRRSFAVLSGHTGGVHALCSLVVGGRQLLASAGADRAVRLWDPATGAPQRELTGHAGGVYAVCSVVVGGRELLASGGADRTVRLWDPATGAQQRILTGHTGWVRDVCSVMIGLRQLLASGGADRTVRLWDPATGAQQRELTGHTGEVHAVCSVMVGGRRLLASAAADGTVRLWDPATGAQQRVLSGHTDWVRAVCSVMVGGRQLLASGGADRTVRMWDPATGAQQRELTGHTGGVRTLRSVTLGERQLLASGGDDRTVRLWDPATGAQLRRIAGHSDWVREVCSVTIDGRQLLASASDDRTVRLWDPTASAQQQEFAGHTGGIHVVCSLTVDGRQLLASGGDDETVRLWSPATGLQQRRLTGHTGGVRALCAVMLGGRQLLASAAADRTVRLWDPATGSQQRRLTGQTAGVRSLCSVMVDGRQLLASAADRTVRLWDPITGSQQRKLTGHTGGVNAVCSVMVGGRELLASAAADRTVRLWDPATGSQQRKLTGHTGGVNAVCSVMVGGRELLASAAADRTVRLWDPITGSQQRKLTGHTGGVNAVCSVMVGGRELLASAAADRTVRLWDPATGREALAAPLPDPPLDLVSHEPDHLFVGLGDGLLLVRVGGRD